MTKSKAQQEAEAKAKVAEEERINDPGKSPSDVNKDSSAAAPVMQTYQTGTTTPETDENKEK